MCLTLNFSNKSIAKVFHGNNNEVQSISFPIINKHKKIWYMMINFRTINVLDKN